MAQIGLDTPLRNPTTSAIIVRYPAHGGQKRSKRRWGTCVWQPGQVSTPRQRFNLVSMGDEAAAEKILAGSDLKEAMDRRALVVDGVGSFRPVPPGSSKPAEPLPVEPYSAHAEKVLAGDAPPPLPSLSREGELPKPPPSDLPSIKPLEPPSLEDVDVDAPEDEGRSEPDAGWSVEDLVAYCESKEIVLTAQQRRSKSKLLRAIAESR